MLTAYMYGGPAIANVPFNKFEEILTSNNGIFYYMIKCKI